MNYSSAINNSMTPNSSKPQDSSIVWQEIISADAKFNLYRINNNSQLRTLYMRRRTQLLRENATKYRQEKEISNLRRSYLNLRKQILENKYGDVDKISNYQGNRNSRAGSKAPSIDSLSLNLDWRENISKRIYAPSTTHSAAISTTLHTNQRWPGTNLNKNSSIYSSKESLNNSNSHSSSRLKTSLSNNNIEDAFVFAGVYHIFENHKGAVTRVKFANNDKSLLATCSLDGTLVICQVIPSPATTIYRLEGHESGIMDMQWNMTNDLIVTCSLDGTSRVWQVTQGKCMRVLKDTMGAQVLCCCFQPLNENMIFTGNSKGLIQVYNLSTGIIVNKNCLQKVSGRVLCMAFDSTGSNVWIGDDKGSISAFHFDILTLKLNKTKRIVSNNGYSITSISFKNMTQKQGLDGFTSVLLVNALPNYLLIYRLNNQDTNSLKLRKRVCIKQSEHALRSTFCPLTNFRKNTPSTGVSPCLVCTGSEDFGVYIYDMCESDEAKCLINKLQGHSSVVKDVGFNYDQSLLVSGDLNGQVIIWKTNNQT